MLLYNKGGSVSNDIEFIDKESGIYKLKSLKQKKAYKGLQNKLKEQGIEAIDVAQTKDALVYKDKGGKWQLLKKLNDGKGSSK